MIRIALQAFCMIAWLSVLQKSPFVYSVYLVVGIIGFILLYINKKEKSKGNKSIIVFSLLFSFAILLANHDYLSFGSFLDKVWLLLAFIGGFCHARNILVWLKNHAKKLNLKKYKTTWPAWKVFLLAFGVFSVLYLVVLFAFCYPGVITPDTASQLNQIKTGIYSNHHPFYHSMIIKLFYSIGLAVFGNEYAGIACYSVASILIMSAIFAYAVVTLYQAKINKKLLFTFTAIFAILPCHIIYSFTIWKDVLFAGGVFLFIIAMYRYLTKLGSNQVLNLIMIIIGTLATCLLRSNGLFVFVIVFIAFLILFRRDQKHLSFILGGVLAVSVVLKMILGPVFSVKPTETTEALSIPLQQVARTLVDGGNISDEELKKISEIIDIETAKSKYLPYLSDPIKFNIRDNGKEQLLSERKFEYLGLWASIGVKNPKPYVFAWVDQTRGYWNGGTYYWNVVTDNYLDPKSRSGNKLNKYISAFNDHDIMRVFLSIGLYFWAALLLLFIARLRRDKILGFLLLAPVAVVLSLLISTPVYAEFRYAYALICCVPFLAIVTFVKRSKRASK